MSCASSPATAHPSPVRPTRAICSTCSALTGLPAAARLALSQTLHLLPRLSETRTIGGVQTYPEGGYEGLARKGSLDSLLPTELAYPADLFFHRVLNAEALYYGRERPRERRRELAFLIMQVGYGLGGDGQILARALLLALSHAMTQRGYDVRYSIAGSDLSDSRPLDKPGEVARGYAYEPVIADAGCILPRRWPRCAAARRLPRPAGVVDPQRALRSRTMPRTHARSTRRCAARPASRPGSCASARPAERPPAPAAHGPRLRTVASH